MSWKTACATLMALTGLALPATASAATYPAGFQEEALVTGLTQPMAVDWTPDGRTLVLEKPGLLKVAAPGSKSAATVFDFRDRVNSNHDRGALGLAVDSSFASNGYVYLLYTYELQPLVADSGGAMVSQLLRIKLSATNQVSDQKVLLGSYTSGICPTAANTVDCIPSDYDSHSIGTVRSAPDGTLFVGSGDGASYAAADRRALRTYDEQSMAGKILRIDREGRGVAGHPMCPSNANLAQVCTKVWAKGLRNPFRFSLRPDGGVNIGDVGWNVTEELNVAPAAGGRSYGWPCYEGTTRTSGYSGFSECAAEYAKPAGTHTGPTTSWCHCSSSASALGGPVYQGERYPAAYRGDSFYADYAKGWIKRLRPDGSTVDFASSWYSGVDLTTGPQGDLTFVTVGDFSAGSGSVVALRYPQGNRAPVARMTTDRTSGAAPLAVAFDGTTSSDADGDVLTYKWEFGDGTTSTAAKPAKTYTAAGSYTAKLTVTDPAGLTDSTSTTITAGNSAPTASIDSPADGSRYRDGTALTLRGSGTDAQDGALAGSRLSWQVVLNHGNHTHVESTLTGSQVSFTPRDDHDADSFYTVQLTATDSGGLTHKRTITIRPETVALKIDSQPAGAPISWAGTDLTAPHTATSAVGFKTAVGAAERFSSGGKSYVFDRWSDGGARSHAVTVPATALNLTAVYREESTPAPTGLVAALNFDEGSGAVARDSSGLSNNASLSGGAAFSASGRSGAAADFAGGSAQATIADNASVRLTGPVTLEAWVRPRSRSDWRTVIFKSLPGWQSYVLYAAAEPYNGGLGGEPIGFVDGDGVRGPGALPLNQWSHLAMTYDGARQRLYVDGVEVASVPRTGPVTTGAGALTIGRNDVWGEPFDGLVDDVRVYSRALSAAQVASDRDTPVGSTTPEPPPPTPTPVAAYGFDEASGSTTADDSPSHATAQVSGAARIAGLNGRALDFDGVNDRVSAPDAPQLRLNGAMTLSAWVRPDSSEGWRTVLLKETGTFQSYALYSAADPYEGGAPGDPAGFVSGDGVRGPARLPTGAWTHLAMTYDGSDERLYVNGVLVATRHGTFTPAFASAPLSIGGNGLWGEWFEGAIDEVRVFDRALSGAQLMADKDRTAATAPVARRSAAPVTVASGSSATAPRMAQRRAKQRVKAKRGRRRAARRVARPRKVRVKVMRGKRAKINGKRRSHRRHRHHGHSHSHKHGHKHHRHR